MRSNFLKIIFRIAWVLCAFFSFSSTVSSQSLGDPIVNITFGTGTNRYGGRLPASDGSTSYSYYDNTTNPGQGFPQDGQYTLTNTSAGMNQVWVATTDHTGDPGGYYMLVNAANTPGIFYTRQVAELCAGTKYQFGAFIKNLFTNNSGNSPNVKFQIETEAGVILQQYDTGNIPADNTWHNYTMEFTTPNTGTIVLKMINNGPGGYGNDLAIDDITFRPYGDPVQVVFDQSASTQFCAGAPQTVKIARTSAVAQGYSQKLQQKINGVWTDMTATINGNHYSFTSPSVAGTYNYRVVSGLSANIGNSQCVVASNELVLTVLPQPTPAIGAPDNGCQNNPIAFRDNSTGGPIASWLWDFGDGQGSTLQNPTHSYTAIGDYTVVLIVTNSNGCSSTAAVKSIHINALPVAAFTVSNPACAGKPVIITDASAIPTGTTVQSRVWEIDGVTVNRQDAQPFARTFTAAGTYVIKLTVTLSTGCSSTTTQHLIVKPLPVVDFDTPPTCISDNTIFTNRTTIADNSALTYQWNFGDNTPLSTAKDPVHKYQSTGDYKITLTVTTSSGCSETLTKDFRVNGATPVADFNVVNKTGLYSNKEVVFENKSRMGAGVFGSVTRVELYYDYDNDRTQMEVDNNPTDGKLYRHTYPEFHSGTKAYTVVMFAYSGGVCVSQQKTEVINLLATPLVVFNQPAAVCANSGTLQLDGHDESNSGIAGSGTYTGTGVSQAGLFDPSVSGAGKFTIQYTYTFTATGSSNTISREITVNSVPTVEVPGSITILQGGSRVVTAKATGSGLTYSWFPTAGLSDATVSNPTVAGISDIKYRVTVTNDSGCQQFAEVEVTVLKTPEVPNAFTPNGDGINDTWQIKYLDSYPGCTVNVFNRNGQKVYSSIGYGTPWDGRSNNGNLTPGVYYYIIDPKNGRKAMSGAVTIIK